jgi:hypothetical protein
VAGAKRLPECYQAYEDGKHRRYELLFAVNGGAFAVARLGLDPKTCLVLGGLSLLCLSVGMVVFTAAMVVDIFFFGKIMRSTLPLDANNKPDGDTVAVFGLRGKIVLITIGVVICFGWLLAAFGRVPGCPDFTG